MHNGQKFILIVGFSTVVASVLAAVVAYLCEPVYVTPATQTAADDNFQKQLELDSVGDEAAPDAGASDAGKTGMYRITDTQRFA